MDQVAVRGMQFDDVETGRRCPPGGHHESLLDGLELRRRQFPRHRPPFTKRYRRGRHGDPWLLLGPQWLATFPGAVRRTLSTCMSELDTKQNIFGRNLRAAAITLAIAD